MSVDLVNAIAGLWKLAGVMFLIVIAVVFRNQFRNLILRITKFKAGKAEVELAQAPEETRATEASKQEAAAPTESTEQIDGDTGEDRKTFPESIGDVLQQFNSGNVDGAEKSFKKLQELEQDQAKKRSNELFYLYLRFRFAQDAEALEKLKKKSQEEQTARDAHYFIGMCYEVADDLVSAAEAYKESAKLASTDSERVSAIISVANCLYRNGKREEAFDWLMAELGKASLPNAVSKIYLALAEIYKQEANQELRAIALEKASESNLSDARLRFDAAYAYGEGEYSEMSLLHYKNLLRFTPADLATLNNLGVAYSTLGMPMKSVEYYSKAAEGNKTLAMANLAYLYIGAGFVKEAREILDKAQGQDEVSPNVGSAMSSLSDKQEEEAKVEKQCLKSACEQQRFLLSFAEAYLTKANDPNRLGFVGFWQSEEGYSLEIFKDGSKIQGKATVKTVDISFEGKILNRGVKIDGYKSRFNSTRTRLLDGYSVSELGDGHGYGYLSPDGADLHLMTINKDKEKQKHRLWVFRRLSK